MTTAVLIDIDGVLYVGDHAVPGAAEALQWIADRALPHLLLTNTTSRPRAKIVEKLAAMGMPVAIEKILTPPVAAVRWLQSNVDGPPALFVPESTVADFSSLACLSPDAERGAAAVVLGDLGVGWDFATYNRAFRLLMSEPRPVLVALGMTRYWRAADGLRLDVGPYVKGLEYATGTQAVVLGKPAAAFFRTALAILGAEAQQVVMVGDDIVGDVAGAQRTGIAGVLVRTGKFRPEDLGRDDIEADAVLETFADLPGWLSRRA